MILECMDRPFCYVSLVNHRGYLLLVDNLGLDKLQN